VGEPEAAMLLVVRLIAADAWHQTSVGVEAGLLVILRWTGDAAARRALPEYCGSYWLA
jgi:hypothetical protein